MGRRELPGPSDPHGTSVLGKLPGEELAKHAEALLAKLEHNSEGVRRAAGKALAKLPGEDLAKHGAHVDVILSRLGAVVVVVGLSFIRSASFSGKVSLSSRQTTNALV